MYSKCTKNLTIIAPQHNNEGKTEDRKRGVKRRVANCWEDLVEGSIKELKILEIVEPKSGEENHAEKT